MNPENPSLFQRLKSVPKLSRSDFALFLVPLVLWAGIERGIRPEITDPRCGRDPESCKIEELWPIDRATVKWRDHSELRRSDFTQNASGVIAAAVPLVLHLGRAVVGAASLPAALAAYGTDLVILLEGTFINGTFNGIVRSVVQRPRPGAYVMPRINGHAESQYTSFYSGHTSFSAVAMLSLFFTMVARTRRKVIPLAVAILGVGLVASTGWLRVTGGAHFPTDVLFAPIPALVITLGLALLHRPRGRA